MTIERRTIIERVELNADGPTAIRLSKQLWDTESGEVLNSEYHRSIVAADQTTAEQLASVNDHLVSLGFPALESAEIVKIEAHRELAKQPADDLTALMGKVGIKLAQDVADLGAQVLTAKAETKAAVDEKVAAQAQADQLRSAAVDAAPVERVG